MENEIFMIAMFDLIVESMPVYYSKVAFAKFINKLVDEEKKKFT